MVFNTQNQLSTKKIQNLKLDIELLNSKIDDYYLQYGELPVLCEYTSDRFSNFNNKNDFEDLIVSNANTRDATLGSNINSDDGDEYVVIDLEKLDGLTLNYGYDSNGEYFTLKENRELNENAIEDEIYVINTTTHQIYFPHGIFADNVMYYMF